MPNYVFRQREKGSHRVQIRRKAFGLFLSETRINRKGQPGKMKRTKLANQSSRKERVNVLSNCIRQQTF